MQFAQAIMAGGLDQTTKFRLFKKGTVQLFTTQTTPTSKNTSPFALG